MEVVKIKINMNMVKTVVEKSPQKEIRNLIDTMPRRYQAFFHRHQGGGGAGQLITRIFIVLMH